MTHLRPVAWPIFLLTLMAAPLALAQPAPMRVRGTIETLQGQDLKVKSREGADVAMKLPDTARTVAVARAQLSDIKAGTYVGIAATPRPDGSQVALEVLIFPEAMRGAGEGHRPWDLMPESTMTNAAVAETVTKTEGQTLTLRYKDGEKTIVVPAGVPIVTFVPATRSDLKPGVRVMATVVKGQDGVATANSVVVGKDGVDPPM